MSGSLILLIRALDLLVFGLEMAPAIREAFTSITLSVRVMITEDRDPTDAEWAQLDTLRDIIHWEIHAAHKE